MNADGKRVSKLIAKRLLKIAGAKPTLRGSEALCLRICFEEKPMMMKSKVGICIAAVVTLAVGSPVFAQSFSASPYGTGNVLPFAYQSVPSQKDKIGQNDRYGYAMVPQTRRAHEKRREVAH